MQDERPQGDGPAAPRRVERIGGRDYELRDWERIEDGKLVGPGYVVDAESGDVEVWMSPSFMGYGPKNRKGKQS